MAAFPLWGIEAMGQHGQHGQDGDSAAATWLGNQGIVKFLEFPVRRPGMSRRDFHLYWSRHHSPHVMNVTGFAQFMRKYTTTHVFPDGVTGVPSHFASPSHLEGVSEVWINSLDDIGPWFGHPAYAELIQPDEARFLAQDGTGMLIIAREEPLYVPQIDLIETGLTKVFLLASGKPGVDRMARHRAASDYGNLILEQAALRQRLQKLVISHKIDPPPQGMELSDIDVVLELWFAGQADMAAFFADPAYAAIRDREAAVFDGESLRALVGKVHVVHDEFSFQPSTTQPQALSWRD